MARCREARAALRSLALELTDDDEWAAFGERYCEDIGAGHYNLYLDAFHRGLAEA